MQKSKQQTDESQGSPCLQYDKDEFALLDKLSTLNKDKIPQGLAQLQSLPILHNNLCAKEDTAELQSRWLPVPAAHILEPAWWKLQSADCQVLHGRHAK